MSSNIDYGQNFLITDDLCRSHDVDYMTGVYPPDADAKLLEGMWDLQHPYLPLFAAALEAKRYFENIAGELYTSSLYYFPDRQKSLTYELWQQSVYDNEHTYLGDNKIGLDLETRWKKLLHGIWLGHCYASVYSPYTLVFLFDKTYLFVCFRKVCLC